MYPQEKFSPLICIFYKIELFKRIPQKIKVFPVADNFVIILVIRRKLMSVTLTEEFTG